MKRVVVQAEGRKAVILNEDGSFETVANRRYRVGQELNAGSVSLLGRVKPAVAAAAAVLVLGGGAAVAYCTPASYASVDINPSVEFRLNMFDRVIGVTGVNEDGQELLKHIRTGSNLGQNIKAIVKEAAQEGYLTPDGGNALVITVTGSGESGDGTDRAADKREAEAKKQAQDQLEETGTPAEVVVERVGYNRVQEARKLGTTPGKLNLVQKYIASAGEGAQVDVNEWLKKPVKEIMKAIKENRKAGRTPEPSPTTTVSPSDTAAPDTTPTLTPDGTQTAAPDATVSTRPSDSALPGNGRPSAKPSKTPKPEKTVKPQRSADDEDGPRPSKTVRPTVTHASNNGQGYGNRK